MIEQYALSLRESSRFIQFVNLAVHEPTHESRKYDFSFPDGKAKLFGLMYVVPLLVVLKMTNNESYNQFVEGKNATPLVDLLENIQMRNDWSYSEFLSRDEYYDTNQPSGSRTKCVTFKQKIMDVYEAIFRNHYNYQNNAIYIGEYQFTAYTKNMLLRAASCLSGYAKYE